MIGILLLIPLAMIPFYPQDLVYAADFLVPAAFSMALGAALCALRRGVTGRENYKKMLRISSVTVVAAWCYGFLAGAMPFVLAGKLTFVQALFEAVSGWTTTGLSVMDVTQTEHIFLFHRSFMQFCGGLGFVMMMVIFIQGKDAMNLYSAEGHPDRLMPSIGKTAKIIFYMYFSFLILGTAVYVLFGMPLFDSVNHAMGALSTGGFSTETDSIGAYESLPIEFTTIVLMLIGTTNFAVLLLMVKRKFGQMMRVSEFKFMLCLLAAFVPAMGLVLSFGLYVSLAEGMRLSLFNAVSALSTTGFSTMPYADWPQAAVGIMILLQLIGGGVGSTAGGMKLTRVYLAGRVCARHMKERVSSKRNVSVDYYYTAQGKTVIDRGLVEQTVGFLFAYLCVFFAGTVCLTITAGCSLGEAMFEFSSALGTVGLSIGLTGPSTDAATLIVEMAGMVLGRLEIFIVFVAGYSLLSAVRSPAVLFHKRKPRKRL